MKIYFSMENLFKMLAELTQWLYAMWAINVIVGIYAAVVIVRYIGFLRTHIHSFGCTTHMSNKILQSFSGILLLAMFISADMWAIVYYTTHTISPIEFFFYAFDFMVVRHLSDEVYRFHTFTK